MAKGSTRKLSELKLECDLLGLCPIPTRNRVNKETGERYLDYSKDDYVQALQSYYIEKYKEQGMYLTGGTGLFRVRMYIGGDSGSCSWQAYTGGIEMLPESTYNSYFKGKKIIGCMCEMNTKEWSLENSPLRGTKISYQNNTHLLLG